MKSLKLLTSGIALCCATTAMANSDLVEQMDNPAQWAIQTGDYKNRAYWSLSASDVLMAHTPNGTDIEDTIDDARYVYHSYSGFLEPLGGLPRGFPLSPFLKGERRFF